jgi:hypothetical protein
MKNFNNKITIKKEQPGYCIKHTNYGHNYSELKITIKLDISLKEYREKLINHFNGFLYHGNVYFYTKNDAQRVIEWFNSKILLDTIGENDVV